MKKLLIPFAILSLFVLTACENPLKKNNSDITFTSNVVISEEEIVLEFRPDTEEPANYEVEYSIEEMGGDEIEKTEMMEGISANTPILITIKELLEGADYEVEIEIKDEEGNEVYEYEETIQQK